MRRDAQVAQRAGHGLLVAGLARQLAGPLKDGHRDLVTAPHDLVEAADPEQRLRLASRVAERLVRARARTEPAPGGHRRAAAGFLPLLEESAVHEPAAGHSQVSLDGVQLPVAGGGPA
ncbi:MAG: hypothetical protein ACLPUO_20335, partial [Streptosporangiaceae bacterium]